MLRRFIMPVTVVTSAFAFAFIWSIGWGQWERDELDDGSESCLRETGERIELETRAGNWASRDCSAFNIFEGWLNTAQAFPTPYHIVQNPDGSFRTTHPLDNADPAPAVLDWDEVCLAAALDGLSGLIVGSATSIDVGPDTCLDGTANATATISLTQTSGAACGDWSIVTNGDEENLTNAGMNTGACSFKLQATESGNSTISEYTATALYSAAPSSPGDTLAPPVIYGLTSPAQDTNQVTLEWDASCDNHDGTEAAGGTKQYNIRLDGSPVETIAATACATGALTQTLIGSSDGTPGSVQDGNDWTLTGGFDGLENDATDHILTRGIARSGTVSVSARIASLTGGGDFAKLGVRIGGGADQTAVGSIMAALYYQKNGAIQFRYRGSVDGGSIRLINNAITAPFDLKITCSDTSCTAYQKATTDNAWTTLATQAVPMGSNKHCSMFIGSQSLGVDATGEIENFNCHSLSRVSRAVSTMSGGLWSVSADDQDDNESAFSAAVSASPGAPPAAGAVKWHPGWCMQILRGSADAVQSTRFGYYDEISADTGIECVVVPIRWSQMEGSEGDYSAGFSLIHAELAKLESLVVPKRLIIRFSDAAYTANADCSIHSSAFLPAYLLSGGYLWDRGPKCALRYWDAAAMDKMIALWQAYGDEFNDEPYFEGFTLPRELALSGGQFEADFSASAYLTQLQRFATEVEPYWPNTWFAFTANWMHSQSSMDALIAHLATLGLTFMDPDTVPDENPLTDGIRTVRGLSGGVDYRGVIPILMGMEVSEMGVDSVGSDGGYSPAEALTYYNDVIQANYAAIDRNTFGVSPFEPCNSLADCGWDTWRTFMNNGANALTNTDCPSSLVARGGCDTD